VEEKVKVIAAREKTGYGRKSLTWGYQPTLTNGLCFMSLVMPRLRSYGIEGEVVWQTDWGEEFGGSNPAKLEGLQERWYGPVGSGPPHHAEIRKGTSRNIRRRPISAGVHPGDFCAVDRGESS